MRPRAVGLALLAALLLAGCSSRGAPGQADLTPHPLVVAADPSLVDPARLLLAAAGVDAQVRPLAEGTDGADVALAFSKQDDFSGDWFPYRRWAAVVPYRFESTPSVGSSAIKDAFFGRSDAFQGSTAFSYPPFPVIPADSVEEVRSMLGLSAIAPSVRRVPLGEALAGSPGTLSLVPIDAVDFHLTALGVDGINPILMPDSEYALTSRIWLGAGDGASAAGLEAARAALLGLEYTPPPRPPLRVVFTGDVIPARCVYATMDAAGDYRLPFEPIQDFLYWSDLLAGSLDTTLSDAGQPIGCRETFNLASPARAIEGLTLAGYDVVTVATNHAKDCGAADCGDSALLETLANLRAAGIQPVGGGRDLAEARRPAIVSVGGVRFAFLGYDDVAAYYHAGADSAGTAGLDEAALREDVAAARAQADVVVVMPHWGVEYTANPSERQREMARAAAAAGATLVVGNHPHWVQAAEWYPQTFVAYGLGNFVFDQDWSVTTMQGAVLEAWFQGPRLVAVDYVPIRINERYQPEFASGDDAATIISRIEAASGALP